MLLLAHVIVPLGDAPETDAVHVVDEPTAAAGGEQLMLIWLGAFPTTRVKLPMLGSKFESPP